MRSLSPMFVVLSLPVKSCEESSNLLVRANGGWGNSNSLEAFHSSFGVQPPQGTTNVAYCSVFH